MGVDLSSIRLHLVETTDDAMDLLRWLSTKDKIGIDTETTGLKPELDHVRLVQVGDTREGWAIPFERNRMIVDDIVRRFEGDYVLHNAPYDWAMLAKDSIKLPRHRIRDTRLMAHVLSSTGSLAQKKLADIYIDPRSSALQQDLSTAMSRGGWTWATVPINLRQYWAYGAMDPVQAMLLEEIFYPQVMATAPKSYELEMAVAWPCEQMERHGVAVDRDYVSLTLEDLTAQATILHSAIFKQWGVKPGTYSVAEKLIEDGVQLTQLTSGGKRYSLDKHVLDKIDHPLAAAVLEYRRITKMTGTYFGPYMQLSELDGRIHPSINTVGGYAKSPFEPGGVGGVRTGRMSSSDPNLQNVPKNNELAAGKVRKGFVPRCTERCGCGGRHVWVSCDFSQIEMRGMAHASRDPKLAEAFATGEDFFVVMGREIFKDPGFTKADPRRGRVKNGMYAKIYGASPGKFAITAGMILPDGKPDVVGATAFLRQLDEAFPGPKEFSEKVIEVANQRAALEGVAYVRSPLTGRKMVADPGRYYALVNYYVQGLAGEILKTKILQADAAGLGPYMTLPVHDEIDLDVPEGMVPEVTETLREVFNDDGILSVPLTASISVGPSWGEQKEV